MGLNDESAILGPDGQPMEQPEPSETSETSNEASTDEHMEVNFINYITSLGFQSMIFLGAIPNPITQKEEKNLKQAKFLIDTLALLKEKTKGNLDEQEEQLLNASVAELQMKYVEVSQS